ncbi:MAG TPA: hypothetical protein VJT82_02850, partial [Pyrinomonadaceae bacterium]|nr:hypothetical protein [Pyrinomonadaceae bacterium]
VNFSQAAEQEQQQQSQSPVSNAPSNPRVYDSPEAPSEPEPDSVDEPIFMGDPPSGGGGGMVYQEDVAEPLPPNASVSSPAAVRGFQAQADDGVTIPPSPHGAVGTNKVMSTLNTNYTIQDKTTGAVLSSLSIQAFWNIAGVANVHSPRTHYDPYNNRWILTAVSNARTPQSSILVGISDTSDPSGTYRLFRYNADGNGSNGTLYADYPCFGFNNNWLVVTVNLHSNTTDTFSRGRVLVVDYPALRAGGTPNTFFFTGAVNDTSFFSLQPAVTYSPTEATEYLVSNFSSAGATYKFFRLTNAPPSLPALSAGTTKSLLNTLGAWTQPGGETLPQAPEAGGTGTRKIVSPDSRVQKVVFRNGGVYFCQTVGLPANRSAATIDRTAAQWVQTNTNGDFLQGGRIEDPNATPTNGGKWYAYPSLAVNKNNDVLVGYTQFASDQYASAGYSFRDGADAAGTMREPVVFKAGEGYYDRQGNGTRNLWGLYSHAVVDPVNDRALWTIQEYAATPVGTGNNSGRWGTWWAKVVPPSANGKIAFVSSRDGNQEVYVMNSDGSNQTNITNNGTYDSDPSWSPDGQKIAFTSDRDGQYHIYVMNADGTGVTQLTSGIDVDQEPSWSPDGTRIAFTRTIIPPPPTPDPECAYPRKFCGEWFNQPVVHQDVFVMNADGSNQTRLTDDLGNEFQPTWSPSGTEIAYSFTNYTFCCNNPMAGCACMLGANYTRIFVMNADGSNKHAVTEREVSMQAQDDVQAAWSPDGSKIIFTRTYYAVEGGGGGNLYTVNPDGSGLARFDPNDETTNSEPAWSPDGTQVVYARDQSGSGSSEIYTTNASGTHTLVLLTNNPADDSKPAWQSQ